MQREIDSAIGEIETNLGLAAVPPPAAAEPAQPTATRVVVTDAVNFRTTPSTEGAVIATLPAGVQVVPFERNGEWIHVWVEDADGQGNRRDGWIYSTYLAEVDAPSSAALTE
jgi:uncharacterized protein YraI